MVYSSRSEYSSIQVLVKENGVNPYYYHGYLFEKLSNINLTDKSALDKLLPWSTTLPFICIIRNPF